MAADETQNKEESMSKLAAAVLALSRSIDRLAKVLGGLEVKTDPRRVRNDLSTEAKKAFHAAKGRGE